MNVAFRLAKERQLTPFKVQIKDDSATLLALRHSCERQLTLEIESDPAGIVTASLIHNGSVFSSGRFPNDEEILLTTFLTGNCNH